MPFAKHTPPVHIVHKPSAEAPKPPDMANVTRIIIRAPNGARFSFWGNDMYLEFQKGKELEAVEFLRNWIDTYVEPVAHYYLQLEADTKAEKEGKSNVEEE